MEYHVRDRQTGRTGQVVNRAHPSLHPSIPSIPSLPFPSHPSGRVESSNNQSINHTRHQSHEPAHPSPGTYYYQQGCAMLGPCSPSSSFFPQPGIVISAPVACWVQRCTSIVLVVAVTLSSFFLSSHSSSPSLWRKRKAGPGRLDTTESHLAAQRSAHWLGEAGGGGMLMPGRRALPLPSISFDRASSLAGSLPLPQRCFPSPASRGLRGERARGSRGARPRKVENQGKRLQHPAQPSAVQRKAHAQAAQGAYLSTSDTSQGARLQVRSGGSSGGWKRCKIIAPRQVPSSV